MSKNVKIKEGNINPTFYGVKKIRINDTEGSSYWVPEDETKLGTKHINENGTYKASEEVDEHGVSKGLYGYSEVTVSGIGVASGINPETGEDAVVEPDENGVLPEGYTDVPKQIGFVTLPPKKVYEDGENITLVGAVVRAYMKDGIIKPWIGDETHPNGIIPLEEVTINPTKADAKSAGAETSSSDLISGDVPLTRKVVIDRTPYNNTTFEIMGDTKMVVGSLSGSTIAYMVAASSNSSDTFKMNDDIVSLTNQYTHDNKTVYYRRWIIQNVVSISIDGEVVNADISSNEANKYAWTIVYGEKKGGKQIINVMWERVGDKKVLKTSFEVVVQEQPFEDGESGHDF